MAKKVKKLVRKFPPVLKAKVVKARRAKVAKFPVVVDLPMKPKRTPVLQVTPEGVVLSKNVVVSADGVVTVRGG